MRYFVSIPPTKKGDHILTFLCLGHATEDKVDYTVCEDKSLENILKLESGSALNHLVQ